MPKKPKPPRLGPASQAYTDAVVGGELVEFTVVFENQNSIGERCWMIVNAFDYYPDQPKVFYLDLQVGDDGESVARKWVHDRRELVDEIWRMGLDPSVPADRKVDVPALTVDGRRSLAPAAHQLVVAMLGEVFVVEPASIALAAKRAAAKAWRTKRAAAKKALAAKSKSKSKATKSKATKSKPTKSKR